MNFIDQTLIQLITVVFALLIVASTVTFILSKKVTSEEGIKTVENLRDRTKAWWVMVFVFVCSLLVGKVGTILLFAASSFLALREYVTLTIPHRADHRAWFWAFFIILPVQYCLIYVEWYGLFSIFIPVYAYLFILIRQTLAGDTEKFLERTSQVQWGMMVCIYFVSHVPALLTLSISNFPGQNAKLLFFLVFIVQISDVMQYIWGKTCGKTKIAPHISPNKTVGGLIGGVISAILFAMALSWATPFTYWQAGLLAMVICIMGVFGGLTMSAIKRARGVKDFGTIIPGHGGVLDRIDSICFSAPIYFHIVRFFWT
jgi:phosphatidate cytidylyltransferase